MPKKKIELEESVEETKVQRKETFATTWFKETATENPRELKIICDLTAESADAQFSMKVRSNNTEVFGVVFYGVFESIIQFIKSKQSHYNEFTIEIANSINVGYCNNTNEDNEKVGNFMPILEFIGINRNLVDIETSIDSNRTARNYIRWKELNIKKTVEYYNEIQQIAGEILIKKYKTDLRANEAAIPLFCIFMDHISNLLKQKYKEADGTDCSEVHINVFGLFDAFYSYDEDEKREIIEFAPLEPLKRMIKDDEKAAR